MHHPPIRRSGENRSGDPVAQDQEPAPVLDLTEEESSAGMFVVSSVYPVAN